MIEKTIGYAEEMSKIRNILFALNPSKLTLEKLISIFREIMDEKDIPLDGDATELLTQCLQDYIDLHEGNITEEEYNQKDLSPKNNDAYICPMCGQHGDALDSDFGEEDGCRTFKCTNNKCNAEWEAVYIIKYVDSSLTDCGYLCYANEEE